MRHQVGWAVVTPPAGGRRRAGRRRAGRARLGPSADLHELMVSWRKRLDPLDVPGYVTADREPGELTQKEIAEIVGVSEMYYGELERGQRKARYSDDILDSVAYALRLDTQERDTLYLWAVGRPATPLSRPPTTAISDGLEWLIHAQAYPAWYSDQAWDLLSYNQAAGEWFPHMKYERNIMRWAYHYPQSQYQLVDWDKVWAPLMFAQMRAARAKFPNNQRLMALVDEARVDCPLWDSKPTIYEHPDGDRRWLHLPGQEDPIQVEIFASTPMRAPDLRKVELVPTSVIDGPKP